ncbi:MAG TPA: polyphosphate kinase 1 [Bacteroidales bacterium]|nr:polyphosphate kinase 1 [Bacteroidales bacterium]
MKNIPTINREVSWLHFNARVLQEAKDEGNPLFERLRFIGIYSNNRDEFFRVRVATLRRLKELQKKGSQGLDFNPDKILKAIRRIIDDQESSYMNTYLRIREQLRDYGIFITEYGQLGQKYIEQVKAYFAEVVRPNLFPIMISGLKDVENLRDNSIYLVVRLSHSGGLIPVDYALVKVPTSRLSRFFIIQEDEQYHVVLLDDVIRYNLDEIFLPFGYDTFHAYSMKFTRDAELDMENDVSKSFIEIMAESLRQRKRGAPVRFIYDRSMPDEVLDIVLKKFRINKKDILIPGWKYHNFRDFMSFPRIGPTHLWDIPMTPMRHPDLPPYRSIFSVIRHKDIMLHFPYQTFMHIIDLLREASVDPKVRSIKMTLYRAARDSNVINALVNAARNGKSVTVFLEIQARFDEKANIQWSEKLIEEGVKVIKTIPGLKVHSKLLLIRRREESGDVWYSNISTGNYNESTAKIYADDSLLTCNPKIAYDVGQMFKLFESPYTQPQLGKLVISPYQTRKFFLKLLNQEIRNARAGKPAWVLLKMNSLVDEKLVEKLYQASGAGVKISIICRGICVLVPGLSGLSENIEVISIVDRFLEHSRVFVFGNDADPKVFLSSADWMVRNLDHRFEVVCPVEDPGLKNELIDMLNIQLSDNQKARLINRAEVNQYRRPADGEAPVRSQIGIYHYLERKQKT